jgi:hypothetical protein
MPNEIQPTAPAGALMPAINPAQMMEQFDAYSTWIRKSLRQKEDIMVLPGTDKPFVTQSGIDRLCIGFGLAVSFDILTQEVDHDRENSYDASKWVTLPDPGRAEKDRLKAQHPSRYRNFKNKEGAWVWQERQEERGLSFGLYRYVVKATVVQRSTGELLGEGIGICSTMETRYVRNPGDAEHTVLAMAYKRAKSRAVLSTLGLTSLFGSDSPVEAQESPASPAHSPEPAPSNWSGSASEGQNSAMDGRPATHSIKGLAVLRRDWLLSKDDEQVLEGLAADRAMKLTTAVSRAQDAGGAEAVASMQAFADWLRRPQPVAEVQG